MSETRSIPEMLGFAAISKDRHRAFSQVSYRAQYLLYEDEANALLREFAPDEHSKKTAHPHINNALALRYVRDPEYRQRIDARYAAMEAKMQKAGVIPEDEAAIKRQMNRLLGDIGEPGIDE